MAKCLLVITSAITALTFVVSAYGQTYQSYQSAKNFILVLNLLATKISAFDLDRRQDPPSTSCAHLFSDLVQEPFHPAYIGGQAQRWEIHKFNSTISRLYYGKCLISFFYASTGLQIESWPHKGITWDKNLFTMILQPTTIEDVSKHSVTMKTQPVQRAEISSFISLQFSVKLNTEAYQPRRVLRQLRSKPAPKPRPPPPPPPTSTCDCTATTNALNPFLSATALSSQLGGASQTLSISIKDTVSLACGDTSGIVYCGVRSVVFYDSLGIVASMPYHQLNWNAATLVLTLTPTSVETFTIFAYVEYVTYPSVYIWGSIQISVFGMTSAPCLLPTSGMNLLNTDVIAYQTVYYPGTNISPNQACDGIELTEIWPDLVHLGTNPPLQYWQAQFPYETLIKSALVINRVDCCGDRIQSWQLQIGNDPALAFNNCNFGQLTSGGWWNVNDSNCKGLYFRIFDSTENINFYEISLYSYKAVQMRAIQASASSYIQNIANALLNIVITASATLSTYCQGPVYAVAQADLITFSSWFRITFTDFVRVKGVVLTGLGATNNPQANVYVSVDGSLCGVITDLSRYAEIDCADKVGSVVKLEKIGRTNTLQFCGFGILTDCDCATSYFFNFVQMNQASITSTSTWTETIAVTQIVNQPPFIGIVFIQSLDIVSRSCGAGTCGQNKVSYTLQNGSPVPWPYNGLSLSTSNPLAGQDTLSITATNDLVGTYTILIRLELIQDSTVFLEARFTWEIIGTQCNNPIGSLNLLDVDVQTSQTSYLATYDLNSGVGCNRVMIPPALTFTEVVAVNDPLTPNRAWSVQLLSQVQIQTVLIVGDLNSKFQDYALTFGSDPNPFSNAVCNNKMTTGGWWACFGPLTGLYFSVTSVISQVELLEVMIYNQQAIQVKAYLLAYSSSLFEYLPANALSKIVSINTGSTSCYASATQTNPQFDFNLNSVTQISGIVALPNEDPSWTAYQTNVEVWVGDPLVVKQCGLFADYNTYSEVKCSQTVGNKVSLKKSSYTSLRFCGVGILSTCDCSTTSFDPKLMPLYKDKSPSEKSLNYTVNGSPQMITFTSNDTVSLVCGLADGFTQCGSRTVTVANKLNGQAVTFFQYTGTSITLKTDNENDVGDYIVTVKIQLDKFNSAKYEFDVAVKILSARPCFKTTLQLEDPTLPLTYLMKKVHWIDEPETLNVPMVIDSISKSSKTQNACGPIIYTLYDAPDKTIEFDINSLRLLFQTKNHDGIVSGELKFTIVASIQNQLTAKPIIFAYTYDLIPCQTEVAPTQNALSVLITAQDPSKEIQLPGFVMTFNCGYMPISYKVTGDLDTVSFYPTTSNYQLGLQQRFNIERDVVVMITPEYSATVSLQITIIHTLTVNVHVLSHFMGVKNQTNSTDLNPPVWIESISTLGLTTILFRDELLIPENLKNVTGQQIKLSYRLASDNYDVAQPFNWTVQNFTSKTLVIQLNFTSPLKVSKYKLLDELQVLFRDPSFFKSTVTKTGIMEPQTVITHDIPKQFASEIQKQLAEATAVLVDACQYGTIVGILIAQLAGKQVIKRIFSFFMMTQLVLMTEYFNGIMIPANHQIVIKSIKDILNMEALPKDKIKTWLFNQVQGEDGSKFDIRNSMSLVGIFLGIGGGLALAILLLYFASKKIPQVHKIIAKIKDALFFGTIIASIQTAYLGVVYSATLSIKGYTLGQSSGTNLAVGIILLLTIIIYLIVVQATITKLTKLQLEEPKRLKMYGALYKNLTLTGESLKWPGIFYARRLAVGVLTAVIENFTVQSHICMYLSIMVGGYVMSVRPISNSSDQKLEAINELTLHVLYMIEIAFCGVVVGDYADEVRVIFGWMFNGIYIGALAINLGFLIYNEVYIVMRIKTQKTTWFKKVTLMGKDPNEILENRKNAEQLKKERKKAARKEKQRKKLHSGEEPGAGAYDIPYDHENPSQKKTKKSVSFSVSIHVPKESYSNQLKLHQDVGYARRLKELFSEQVAESKVTNSELREAEIKLEQHNRNAHYQLEEQKVRETLSEKKLKFRAFQEKLKKMSFDATRGEEWDY